MSTPSASWVADQIERIERVRRNLPQHARRYPVAYGQYLDANAKLAQRLAAGDHDGAMTCMALAWAAGQDSGEEEKTHG